MPSLTTLADYLAADTSADDAVKTVVAQVAKVCGEISAVVAMGAINDTFGAAGVVNVQQEEQQKLDVITNDIMRNLLAECPVVAGLASEELETIETTGRIGGVLVLSLIHI